MKQIIDVSTKGLCSIKVTSEDIIRDHVVLLDLVDGLAFSELLTLVRKPLALVVLFALLELLMCLSLIKKLILWNWSLI